MDIKNVVSVERTLCDYVKVRTYNHGTIVLRSGDPWRKVRIIGPARLEITDKCEDRNHLYTAKLSFSRKDILETSDEPWAYRCTCADGSVYIIGCDRRPFPVTTHSQTLSENVTDSTLNRYDVEYNSREPIMRVAVL